MHAVATTLRCPIVLHPWGNECRGLAWLVLYFFFVPEIQYKQPFSLETLMLAAAGSLLLLSLGGMAGKPPREASKSRKGKSKSKAPKAAPVATVDTLEAWEAPPPLLTEDLVDVIVYTTTMRELCKLRAYRGWRLCDLKDGICDETGIEPIAQKLWVGKTEVPEKTLLEDLFPSSVEGGAVILHRRTPEQAQWLAKCREYGLQLEFAPAAVKANFEVVMAAVMKNPKAIQFAAPELRRNKEVMLVAIKQDIDCADFLDPAAWSNRDFVIEAVRVDWQLLRMACEEFLRDPEIVLAAIESNWDAVSVAAPEAWEYIEVPRAAAVTGGWTVHNVAPHELQARRRFNKPCLGSCFDGDLSRCC